MDRQQIAFGTLQIDADLNAPARDRFSLAACVSTFGDVGEGGGPLNATHCRVKRA
jgi:hypothetical protein